MKNIRRLEKSLFTVCEEGLMTKILWRVTLVPFALVLAIRITLEFFVVMPILWIVTGKCLLDAENFIGYKKGILRVWKDKVFSKEEE